jgi:hypothetical protein
MIFRSAVVLGALLLCPGPLVSQTRCGAQASIDKVQESPVINSTDIQYVFAIRVVSSEKACLRVTPTIALTTRATPPSGEPRDETFETEGPPIVVRGGAGTARMAQQSPTKIIRAKVTAVACGPCEPGDDVSQVKREGKGPIVVLGAGALAAGATAVVLKAAKDSFPGSWLGQLRMSNVQTFGVGCELLSSITYGLNLTLARDGEVLTGTCSVVPMEVNPRQCAFAVPPQAEPLRGTLKGDDFNVTCGNAGSRAGVLSGVVLAGAKAGNQLRGTARTPLGEAGEWEVVQK